MTEYEKRQFDEYPNLRWHWRSTSSIYPNYQQIHAIYYPHEKPWLTKSTLYHLITRESSTILSYPKHKYSIILLNKIILLTQITYSPKNLNHLITLIWGRSVERPHINKNRWKRWKSGRMIEKWYDWYTQISQIQGIEGELRALPLPLAHFYFIWYPLNTLIVPWMTLYFNYGDTMRRAQDWLW